jgi:hypothetical protein
MSEGVEHENKQMKGKEDEQAGRCKEGHGQEAAVQEAAV